LRLIDAFRLNKKDRIAFTGAGGKTMALFCIAREFEGPVLISTTTHLGAWQSQLADKHWIIKDDHDFDHRRAEKITGVTLVTGATDQEERLSGFDNEKIQFLLEMADKNSCPLLIEADGARTKPLKAPELYEPVIPDFVTHVIVIAGMSGYQQRLDENVVHRPGLYAKLSGLSLGEKISMDAMKLVLSSQNGGKKGIPAGVKAFLLLNQADDPLLQSVAGRLARMLRTDFEKIAITSLQTNSVYACFHKIAGIVLAAGGASRLQVPKQLLQWRGESFVSSVAKTAIAAGLDPVIVVLGAYHEAVKKVLDEMPVHFVNNLHWKEGQSTSIKVGIKALPEGVEGAIFLLADQPQLSISLVKSLMESAWTSSKPVITPLIDGKRGNPVYFSSETFDELSGITGDQGGRAIFSKYPPQYLDWFDESQKLDVDTLDDLARLRKFE
jgi:molybdenum cofactor cytidylyltransferase